MFILCLTKHGSIVNDRKRATVFNTAFAASQVAVNVAYEWYQKALEDPTADKTYPAGGYVPVDGGGFLAVVTDCVSTRYVMV